MIAESVLATCIFLAAQQYEVPPPVLIGIMRVEGGRVGQEVGPNTNGTYDLGLMQINTLWMPVLAKKWKVSNEVAHRWVRDDACINIGVAAWILRQKINETGSLSQGIAHYHSATPHIGSRYRQKIVATMQGDGLIKE